MSTNDNNNGRLKAAIIYVCYSFKDDILKLGSVKLNKILWFSDAQSLKERYKAITGLPNYEVQERGPVVPEIRKIMTELSEDGIIKSSKNNSIDYQQWIDSIMDKKEAVGYMEQLGDDDKKILDRWIGYARDHKVKEIVNKAHSYSWWKKVETKKGSPIPTYLGALESQSAVNELTR